MRRGVVRSDCSSVKVEKRETEEMIVVAVRIKMTSSGSRETPVAKG